MVIDVMMSSFFLSTPPGVPLYTSLGESRDHTASPYTLSPGYRQKTPEKVRILVWQELGYPTGSWWGKCPGRKWVSGSTHLSTRTPPESLHLKGTCYLWIYKQQLRIQ
jgi:hypothetical protein